MRQRPVYVLLVVTMGSLGCQAAGVRDSQEGASRVVSGFEVHHGWPVLRSGYALGFVTGVEFDSHGHLFTFQTYREWRVPFPTELEAVPTIHMWDMNDGSLLDSWGADLFRMPHGLSIDADDNIWVTDVGHSQVFKFSHDGELLMSLGEAGVEGADQRHFAQPTDIEFGLDGSVYVSDGYVNSRIVNFSPEGKFRFEWGRFGDGPGQFNIPHDLAVDGDGRVYVADRENDRVQAFEADGEFVSEWRSGGSWRPYGLAISQTLGRIFVVDGGEQPPTFPDRSGVVVLDLSGNFVERFGRFGNQDGQFMMGHDITVTPGGIVYVVDVLGRRVQKFSRTQ